MSFKIEILLIPLLQAISHIFEISEDDHPLNIGAFCLRMRENRSVRLQMADFKGFVSFVMVFMKNMD
jgi:hypothetical protein